LMEISWEYTPFSGMPCWNKLFDVCAWNMLRLLPFLLAGVVAHGVEAWVCHQLGYFFDAFSQWFCIQKRHFIRGKCPNVLIKHNSALI
jgi:hypothetical protein